MPCCTPYLCLQSVVAAAKRNAAAAAAAAQQRERTSVRSHPLRIAVATGANGQPQAAVWVHRSSAVARPAHQQQPQLALASTTARDRR
jgi:hypothetical protein